MYGTVRTVVWADGRGNPPSDPILLTREENFVGLMAVNREVLAQAEMPTHTSRIVLDMNLSGRAPDTHRGPPCAASSTTGRPD